MDDKAREKIPQDIASALKREVLQRGSGDNIICIVPFNLIAIKRDKRDNFDVSLRTTEKDLFAPFPNTGRIRS